MNGRRLLLSILTIFLPLLAAAQVPADTAVGEPPLTVSIVTASPGSEIYQLEGHSAIRLQRPGRYDLAVNWGVFDFKAPNFVWRFVKGETDYMVAAYPFHYFIEEYAAEGRRLVEQRLLLDSAQTARVEELISRNLRPENATYRYNYVRDNCATRPLGIVEEALGEPLVVDSAFISHVDSELAGATWRSEMTRYHANYPWYQFGIDLALGAGLDRPLELRELAFAPVFLCDMLAHSYVASSDGSLRPLAGEPQVLLPGKEEGVVLPPTSWLLSPMAVAVDLLVITLIISFLDIRRRRLSRWFDSLLFGVFFLTGCLLSFLIFVSVHEATSPNWLYLWLNPLCIIAAVGVWIKSWRRVVYCYQICNFAALILLLAGHHFFGQAFNPAFPLLIVCDLIRSATCIYVYRSHPKTVLKK